jgi:hypothetical protein
MVSLKLLCSSAADDELIPPWLSVRGPARFQYDYILFIT